MLLYLIRHAEAVELGTPGAARDFDRASAHPPRPRDQSHACWRTPSPSSSCMWTCSGNQPSGSRVSDRGGTGDRVAPGRLPRRNVRSTRPRTPETYQTVRFPRLTVPGEAIAAVGHMPELGGYLEWLKLALRGGQHPGWQRPRRRASRSKATSAKQPPGNFSGSSRRIGSCESRGKCSVSSFPGADSRRRSDTTAWYLNWTLNTEKTSKLERFRKMCSGSGLFFRATRKTEVCRLSTTPFLKMR